MLLAHAIIYNEEKVTAGEFEQPAHQSIIPFEASSSPAGGRVLPASTHPSEPTHRVATAHPQSQSQTEATLSRAVRTKLSQVESCFLVQSYASAAWKRKTRRQEAY